MCGYKERLYSFWTQASTTEYKNEDKNGDEKGNRNQ